jgi:hypothetical protein
MTLQVKQTLLQVFLSFSALFLMLFVVIIAQEVNFSFHCDIVIQVLSIFLSAVQVEYFVIE